MAIKNINTDLQIEAGLRDGDGDLGTNNQVLISTGTGINWVDGSGSGIIGGPYLPLGGGTMTGTNGVLMPDNFKLNLGTSSDLQIYHDGSNSFIQDTGTGDLYVDAAANFFVRNVANGDVWIKGTDLGVSLRYQDSQKLITTSTGITVTGELEATTLDINGNADISGNLTVDGGNVGIGTTNPSQKLEVALGTSSGSDGIFIKGYFAGGSSYIDSKKPFISLGTSISNTYTSTIYLGASATATDQDSKIEWSKTNNALSIYHKGQGTYREHVRFGDPSSSIAKSVFFGNVGIGVTSPSARLDVNTGGLAAKFVSTQNTALEVQGGANAQDIARFKNTGGNVQFVINNGGYVGIGAASPSEKLEVAGNILANATNATVNIGSTISSTPAYGYANTAAGSLVVGGYTNGGYFYQPGVITLINQNPGIGAGADLGVIQFAGKDDATSGYVSTIIKAFTAAGAGSGNSGGGILTISTTPGYGSPIERFRINQNGNVGIGTTSPGQKLEVDGEVLSDGYRLSAMQTAPAARNSTGTLGEIRITSNYIYVCYATNSWSRVALATSW